MKEKCCKEIKKYDNIDKNYVKNNKQKYDKKTHYILNEQY
jgi:hypothetical protein